MEDITKKIYFNSSLIDEILNKHFNLFRMSSGLSKENLSDKALEHFRNAVIEYSNHVVEKENVKW
jgi:hypothetical protein